MAGETVQREDQDTPEDEDTPEDGIVLRRSRRGWRVGPEQTADLISAMVLADLLAADLGPPAPPASPASSPRPPWPLRQLRATLPRTTLPRTTLSRRRGWR